MSERGRHEMEKALVHALLYWQTRVGRLLSLNLRCFCEYLLESRASKWRTAFCKYISVTRSPSRLDLHVEAEKRKRTNPNDRRGILLSIAPAGRIEIGKIGDEIRAINDLFFGALDAKAFAALSAAVGALVLSSRKAIHYVSATDQQELEAAE